MPGCVWMVLGTCWLLPGEPPPTLPRTNLHPGQELVYRGVFLQEVSASTHRPPRRSILEMRFFVLAANQEVAHVALQTSIWAANLAGEPSGQPSVQVALAEVTPMGEVRIRHVHGTTQRLERLPPPPLGAPPPLEAGFLPPMPPRAEKTVTRWDAMELGQPPTEWQIEGREVIRGTRCIRLTGRRQSPEWVRPRPDRPGWQRVDRLWVSPFTGYALRVERVIERRDPTAADPSTRSELKYALIRTLRLPRPLVREYQRDLAEWQRIDAEYRRILPQTGRNPQPFEALMQRIDQHLAEHAGTPYLEAIRDLRWRVEQARAGGLPSTRPARATLKVQLGLSLGQLAPDFVAPNLLSGESVRLARYWDRPVVLLYLQPNTRSGELALRQLELIRRELANQVHCLAMLDRPGGGDWARQQRHLGVGFPILDGAQVHRLHGIDTTPVVVILKPQGSVVERLVGWGAETPGMVRSVLKGLH